MTDYHENPTANADLAAWDNGANIYSDLSMADQFKDKLDDPAFLALLGSVGGVRVLDMGCGDGTLCRKLNALGALTTGLDSSPQMLKRARTADPDGDYRLGDMGSPLPFSPDSYDIVAAKMSLMCVGNVEAVARNVHQVLTRGGLFAADIVHPVQPLLTKLAGQETMYGLPPDYAYNQETRGDITFGDATFFFYNRPVSHYINEVTAAGFALQRMNEIVIDEDFARKNPNYAGAANQPISMHLLFQASATRL